MENKRSVPLARFPNLATLESVNLIVIFTYEDTGHEIKDEMIEDIAAFFQANSGDEIVEIVPHQYPWC